MNQILLEVNGHQKIITQNACLRNKIIELPGLLNPDQAFHFSDVLGMIQVPSLICS